MIPYLPPIQALRAFEAAARHASYTRAAQELFLTHGAISQHIARLEGALDGVRLFVRDGHSMVLTDAGRVLVVEVRESLMMLAESFNKARARPSRNEASRMLSVSVLPGLAAHWLVPRLSGFQALYRDIDIAIRPTASLAVFDGRDGIDLGIRYGAGNWPGLHAKKLMKSVVFPVCSPAFMAKERLEEPSDLLRTTLLRNPRQKWRPWFLKAGIDLPEPGHGPVYDDAGLLVQAAAQHQGVALARAFLVADDLAAGRLSRIGALEIEDDYSWFLVWREPLHCDADAHSKFREWLAKEADEAATP